jgi:predicted DNA binding CopG/RHH family protein
MNDPQDSAKKKRPQDPGARGPKRQITIRLGPEVLAYFKQLAEETGIPYQSLINLYLYDCVTEKRRPSLKWFT